MTTKKTTLSLLSDLEAKPYWLSIIFTLCLIVWMASGDAPEQSKQLNKNKAQPLIQVQVTSLKTQKITRSITLYGRSEPNRQTTIKAEVHGRIDKLYAKRGARVSKGDKINKIELNDKKLQLAQAKSLLRQREIEHKGSLSLSKQGYQGKVRLAEAETAFDMAKALVSQLQLAVKKTRINAPYDGVLNERFVELGDYVAIGDPIAVITDIDPLIVRANVSEKDVASLILGQMANVTFITSKLHQGRIRYISSVSDPATNTFKVEVELPNTDHKLLAGLSAKVEFPLEEVQGLKVSFSLLTSSDDGTMGIKTVKNNRVVFTPVQLISSDEEGVWLSGFEQEVDVISVWKDVVSSGDKVDVVVNKPALQQTSEPAQEIVRLKKDKEPQS